jgi:DNA invertase Pin-like site-specific DNA recombinase
MTGTHPQNRRLGYARVSTYGQTLDAQLEQLRAAGRTRIYREKGDGHAQRPAGAQYLRPVRHRQNTPLAHSRQLPYTDLS